MKIDFIGDIHGDAYKLKALLEKLGYKKEYLSGDQVYIHPEGRKAQFIGDYIDRGPDSKQVLDIVIAMVKYAGATAMLGNHEFNYLAYFTKHSKTGKWLRPHTDKNNSQNKVTRDSIGDDKYYLDFMKKMKIYDYGAYYYATHAFWDQDSINLIRNDSLEKLGIKFLEDASDKEHHYFEAIEKIIKGPEYFLEEQYWFTDTDSNTRKYKRLEWWDSTEVLEVYDDPSKIVDYGRPIFFGHYSLKSTPHLLDDNICCLDFGDFKNEKYVTAYRFDGEMILKREKLVWV